MESSSMVNLNPSEQSLASFLCEVARRVPRAMPRRIDGEMRKPLPSLLYRIYEAPHTMEHRILLKAMKAIIQNARKSDLRHEEIDALSPDVLHLLDALVSDYLE